MQFFRTVDSLLINIELVKKIVRWSDKIQILDYKGTNRFSICSFRASPVLPNPYLNFSFLRSIGILQFEHNIFSYINLYLSIELKKSSSVDVKINN